MLKSRTVFNRRPAKMICQQPLRRARKNHQADINGYSLISNLIRLFWEKFYSRRNLFYEEFYSVRSFIL